MASSDIDQKYLAHIGSITEATHPALAKPLYTLLGLSSMLSGRVNKAKKMRRLDVSRDTPSLSHYKHIIWLVREGLQILETEVLPHTIHGKLGAEATVLVAKLRASFYHLLSIFHNEPPVSQVPPPRSSSFGETASGVLGVSHRHNNSKSSIVSEKFSPKANQSKSKNCSRGRTPTLRDPVASATSDASFVTNPYANNRSGSAVSSPAPPPGLGGPTIVPRPSAFLFPAMNFLPITESHFVGADQLATALLPGSHPLRLSTAVEHCAFIWDCLHDFQYARRHARQSIRAVYHAKEGMDDDDFEEAAKMVDQLGKIMKRRSWDGAVRPAGEGVPEQIQEETPQSQIGPVAQGISVGQDVAAQPTPPYMEQTPLTTSEQKVIKPGGGSRGVTRLEDYLRKHSVFQFFRRLKNRIPMRKKQVRKDSRKHTPPVGLEQVGDQPDGPDRLLPKMKHEHGATDSSCFGVGSFHVRMGGSVVPDRATHSQSSKKFSPLPYKPSGRLRRGRCPAPIDTGLANRDGKTLPVTPASTDSSCYSFLPPVNLDKSLPPTPCSSLPSPLSPVTPVRLPSPINVDAAEAAKSEIIDEYQWSPRVYSKKHHLLRNVGGLARFRNEAFPPIEGARMEGNPIRRVLPTPIQSKTGEVQQGLLLRWIQPVTVFDRPAFDAAVKKREEKMVEEANRKKKEEYEYQAAMGKQMFEKLKAEFEWKMAHEPHFRAQPRWP